MRRQCKKVNLLADIKKDSNRPYAELVYLFQEATRSDDKYAQAPINRRTAALIVPSINGEKMKQNISMHFRQFRIEQCLDLQSFYPSYIDCEQDEAGDDYSIQILLSMEDLSEEDTMMVPRPVMGAFATLSGLDDL